MRPYSILFFLRRLLPKKCIRMHFFCVGLRRYRPAANTRRVGRRYRPAADTRRVGRRYRPAANTRRVGRPMRYAHTAC